MKKRRTKKVEYLVETSAAGPYPHPKFASFAEAVKTYKKEISTPSYIRPGTMRSSRVYKITTIVEELTRDEIFSDGGRWA